MGGGVWTTGLLVFYYRREVVTSSFGHAPRSPVEGLLQPDHPGLCIVGDV